MTKAKMKIFYAVLITLVISFIVSRIFFNETLKATAGADGRSLYEQLNSAQVAGSQQRKGYTSA